jgi:hypothetical protein
MSFMLAAGKLVGDAKLITRQRYDASRNWIHCVGHSSVLVAHNSFVISGLPFGPDLNRDWNDGSTCREREFTDHRLQQMALPGRRRLLLGAKIVLL